MTCSCNPHGTCACYTPLVIEQVSDVLCVDSRHSKLEAENARLREALYEITTETLVYNGVPEIEQIGAIARAALEDK